MFVFTLVAETESIDSENWQFEHKLNECRDLIPNLISRSLFNDRCKTPSDLCEKMRKRIANAIECGEEN